MASVVTVALTAVMIGVMLVKLPAPAAADELGDEAQFVAMINEVRASEGLGTLEIDLELRTEARVWADQLRQDDELSHASDLSVGITSYWLKLGENVGVAPQDQIEALFDAFVASPDHYANLIDPDFTTVGIGVTYGDDGRIWTAHRFMATGADPATAPPTPTETATSAEPATTPATTVPASEPATLLATELATVPLDQTLVAELLDDLATVGI